MATPSNHWKLGLFVVAGVVVGLGTVLILGARSLQKETVNYETFMDESVQGLEVGSPVKFRGVTIGTVASIGVAPDRRHVDLTSALAVDDIVLMGLAKRTGRKAFEVRVPPEIRMQLASAGITGVKFLQLDFFDVKNNPLPLLPFPTPDNYIPAAVSTMKNLEDAVIHAVDRFPEMTDAALLVLSKLDALLSEVGERRLPERTAVALDRADEALSSVKKTFREAEAGKISLQTRHALEQLDGTIAHMNGILARVDGDKGVIVSAERASDAVGDVATNARGFTDELGTTLRDVQLAAESIQKLTDALERDSDMLVKGRASSR
jgi:phospholipid/cholesterol/gamma-HCH transport system substrate-binding protein